jgi:hypothetical protein
LWQAVDQQNPRQGGVADFQLPVLGLHHSFGLMAVPTERDQSQ